VGDDDRSFAEHGVTADMVTVAVGVDDDPYGTAAKPGELVADSRRSAGVPGVHQESSIAADRRNDTDVAVAAKLVEISGDVTDLDRWRLVGLLGKGVESNRNDKHERDEQRPGVHDVAPFHDVSGRRASSLVFSVFTNDIRIRAVSVLGEKAILAQSVI
jgi:hypothetical protein